MRTAAANESFCEAEDDVNGVTANEAGGRNALVKGEVEGMMHGEKASEDEGRAEDVEGAEAAEEELAVMSFSVSHSTTLTSSSSG